MSNKFFLDRENTVLIVIDFQEKLTSKMKYAMDVSGNIKTLIESFKILDLPIILTEQYPEGIGHTEKGIIEVLPEYKPVIKVTFSCYREKTFLEELERCKRKTLLLVGIETHVCVLQTALDCIEAGYDVHVLRDAVSSRSKSNWETGLKLMRDAGIVISSTEIAIFQLLKEAGTKEFKAIHKFIK
ncbi:MAG TPA: hydrolase [Candidatus Eremiobacteraeota bacterium]|nr:MAG: putative hydrolase [bacterium ADurb.Bin363]HPZ08037.1 hydrolase [Candidatus Eremiobacteraeota bacterium]